MNIGHADRIPHFADDVNRKMRTDMRTIAGYYSGMIVSQPAILLREFRKLARLSVRGMAEALDIPKSTYLHYETRFKEPYLPAEFAEQVASVLAGHGVPRGDVMALATPPDQGPAVDDLRFASRYRELSPHRQKMVRDLFAELEAAQAALPHKQEAEADSQESGT